MVSLFLPLGFRSVCWELKWTVNLWEHSSYVDLQGIQIIRVSLFFVCLCLFVWVQWSHIYSSCLLRPAPTGPLVLSWWTDVGASTSTVASSFALWKLRILGTTAVWPATIGAQMKSRLTCRFKVGWADVTRRFAKSYSWGVYLTSCQFWPAHTLKFW